MCPGADGQSGANHASVSEPMPRFFVDLPLSAHAELVLPPEAARHVQVLRRQPGDDLTLFNGQGGEWVATVLEMGRRDVRVRLAAQCEPVDRELALPVTLVVGMPANDRFDWLVEKATELGVAAIWPVMAERSVLRLEGERAQRRQAHWQAVAVAAAEQCGRTRVPRVAAALPLARLLQEQAGAAESLRWLLSPGAQAQPLAQRVAHGLLTPDKGLQVFSGPEGGFTPTEEALLQEAGALPTQLGPRILRAETAPLALLATLGLMGWMGPVGQV